MKQLLSIGLLLLLISASACTQSQAHEDQLTPRLRYELSGGAGHYDYAPSVIVDQYGIRYCFLCENRDPFKIVDFVYLYKGIPTENGIQWQPGTQILAPSAEGWDNCHICDPDVREFTTRYKGEDYQWIMTYLGVDQWDCNHNQIGLAVSKCIEGPYIKVDSNPLVPYEGRDKWGVGQSTTIVKNDSTVVVFYHSSAGNGFCCREIKLDDLDHIELGEEQLVPFLGSNTYPCFSKKNIYMVSEVWSAPHTEIPTWVGDECHVSYRPLEEGYTTAKSDWRVIGKVAPALSGFPRNHNPGFMTDTKGYLPDEDELVVYYTSAVTGEDWLWSYDLYSATFNLKNYFPENN